MNSYEPFQDQIYIFVFGVNKIFHEKPAWIHVVHDFIFIGDAAKMFEYFRSIKLGEIIFFMVEPCNIIDEGVVLKNFFTHI